jgi:hypothetical protein
MLETLTRFLFILAVPVVVVAGGLVSLFAVGALFDALDHPSEISTRVEAAFRRPPKPGREPGPKHYYKPYWAR